ncbi:MAG TPA: hypothetical protein VJK52_06345 [Candidatus Nanoarchaeia archaeon]|nr:hypothetical protein [Candidatus Nanoarchaeia archaeon]
MFDPNLRRDQALEDIGGVESGVTFQAIVEKRIINLCRETSDARNHCFANESNYRDNFTRFKELPNALLRELARSEPFGFIHNNLGVYANAGELQRKFADAVFFLSIEFLVEIMSNAMAESDNVETSIHITPKGVLVDVNQGMKGFDTDFLQDVRKKSTEVYELITQGISMQEMISQTKHKTRRTIGFVPPDLEGTMNGLPHRGNGIANMLVNDLFRTNFIADTSNNRTIAFHDLKQLKNVVRFKASDPSAISAVYGPSDVPIDKATLDDLFSSGFDFKNL